LRAFFTEGGKSLGGNINDEEASTRIALNLNAFFYFCLKACHRLSSIFFQGSFKRVYIYIYTKLNFQPHGALSLYHNVVVVDKIKRPKHPDFASFTLHKIENDGSSGGIADAVGAV
jgi:hypothetical protein